MIGQLSGKDRKRLEAVQVATRIRLAAKDPNVDAVLEDAQKIWAWYQEAPAV